MVFAIRVPCIIASLFINIKPHILLFDYSNPDMCIIMNCANPAGNVYLDHYWDDLFFLLPLYSGIYSF